MQSDLETALESLWKFKVGDLVCLRQDAARTRAVKPTKTNWLRDGVVPLTLTVVSQHLNRCPGSGMQLQYEIKGATTNGGLAAAMVHECELEAFDPDEWKIAEPSEKKS